MAGVPPWAQAVGWLGMVGLCCLVLVVVWLRARSGGKGGPSDGLTARAMIILGSGGHTAEMLAMLESLDLQKYAPRRYVVASTDQMSERRVRHFEDARAAEGVGGAKGGGDEEGASFVVIPRSREVGQSYFTSVATTLRASWFSVFCVLDFRPEIVLCNGPGTGLPVCAAGWLQNLLGLGRCRVVYVESMARVESLSLTGHILYRLRMADGFYVMWPGLVESFPRAKYLGRIM